MTAQGYIWEHGDIFGRHGSFNADAAQGEF